MWILIVDQILIKLQKEIGQINHDMAQISFCLSLKHTRLLPLAVCFDTFVENLITDLFLNG